MSETTRLDCKVILEYFTDGSLRVEYEWPDRDVQKVPTLVRLADGETHTLNPVAGMFVAVSRGDRRPR